MNGRVNSWEMIIFNTIDIVVIHQSQVVMKWFKKFVSAWFSLSHSERNGTLVLAVIILLIILGWVALPQLDRPWRPERDALDREMRKFIASADSTEVKVGIEKTEVLPFDPNTASLELLLSAGLKTRTANNLIRFREKGGRIRSAEDMKKLYGITSEEWNAIRDKVLVGTNSQTLGNRRDSFPSENTQLQPGSNKGPEWRVVELNSADSLALESLPGIGPVLASRIIRYRERLGGFISLSQLLEVYGMKPEWYEKLVTHLRVDSSQVHPLDLNRIRSEAELRHPYLTPWQTQAIWKYLSMGRKVTSSRELIDNKLLRKEEYEKIKPYLTPR